MTTRKIPRRVVDEYHDEVVAALRQIGNPRRGTAVAKDSAASGLAARAERIAARKRCTGSDVTSVCSDRKRATSAPVMLENEAARRIEEERVVVRAPLSVALLRALTH